MTTDRQRIRDIATLLCDTADTEDANFMLEVVEEMRKRGYTIGCNFSMGEYFHLLVMRTVC